MTLLLFLHSMKGNMLQKAVYRPTQDMRLGLKKGACAAPLVRHIERICWVNVGNQRVCPPAMDFAPAAG